MQWPRLGELYGLMRSESLRARQASPRGKARARPVYDETDAPLGGKENKFEGMMLDCECPSAIAYARMIIHYTS